MHQVHTLNLGCTHRLACLLRLLCACSGCNVPAQPSICHNTAEPTVCLLNLLYATIQPSLLCACSAFYMPQYSQAYCVPAQPSICHNTVEPTVCLLSLLYATIQYKYCNTIFFFQPAYNTILSLQYTSSLSFKNLLSHDTLSVL